LAKVDPFVIQWPNKWMSDPEIRPVIEYLNRFLHDLFIRTGGGFDLIEDAEVGASIGQSDAVRLMAQLTRLEKRVEAVEERDFDGLNAKIARLNRKLDTLLETLITEIRLLNNQDFESKLLSLQSIIVNELELLNLRSEEAWETGLDRGDTE